AVDLIARDEVELRPHETFGGAQLQLVALDVPFLPAKLFAAREGLGQADVPVGDEFARAGIVLRPDNATIGAGQAAQASQLRFEVIEILERIFGGGPTLKIRLARLLDFELA